LFRFVREITRRVTNRKQLEKAHAQMSSLCDFRTGAGDGLSKPRGSVSWRAMGHAIIVHSVKRPPHATRPPPLTLISPIHRLSAVSGDFFKPRNIQFGGSSNAVLTRGGSIYRTYRRYIANIDMLVSVSYRHFRYRFFRYKDIVSVISDILSYFFRLLTLYKDRQLYK